MRRVRCPSPLAVLGLLGGGVLVLACGGEVATGEQLPAFTGGSAGSGAAASGGAPFGGQSFGGQSFGGQSFGGFAGSAVGGAAGVSSGGLGGRPVADAGPDAYVDPGCPDAAPLPPIEECDAFAAFSGCPDGYGCYPFVEYPGEKCGQEQYGTSCRPAGFGEQGDACSGSECAPGHVCVITGVATQCAELCPLDRPDGCPPGLFCVSVDVKGYGVCY